MFLITDTKDIATKESIQHEKSFIFEFNLKFKILIFMNIILENKSFI